MPLSRAWFSATRPVGFGSVDGTEADPGAMHIMDGSISDDPQGAYVSTGWLGAGGRPTASADTTSMLPSPRSPPSAAACCAAATNSPTKRRASAVRSSSSRTIEPGKVFDLVLPLEQVAEGYRAMYERRAIKTLLRP